MKRITIPKFTNESEEADWWPGPAGREYVKQRSAGARTKGVKLAGSRLVEKLDQRRSIPISLRVPETDLDRARKVAKRKGIGYQTLLKMLVHEGLEREAERG